ncbi:MAG: hypothetical protein WCK60_01455 [Candidatus Nomurabacteria bacterium]
MDFIYTRAQARALFLVKSAQTIQLQKALSIAQIRVNRMKPEDLTNTDKLENVRNLSNAISIISQPNHRNDLTIRIMFQYVNKNMQAIDSFTRTERFSTLRKIVDVPFEEIKSTLCGFGLNVPIALQTFYEVYHELTSERSLQIA